MVASRWLAFHDLKLLFLNKISTVSLMLTIWSFITVVTVLTRFDSVTDSVLWSKLVVDLSLSTHHWSLWSRVPAPSGYSFRKIKMKWLELPREIERSIIFCTNVLSVNFRSMLKAADDFFSYNVRYMGQRWGRDDPGACPWERCRHV